MKKLLLDESPLIILPSLAVQIGLNEAIFVQQLHYWISKSTKTHNNKKWVHKTLKEWNKEFPFWSEATIKRTVSKLKKEGIISVEKLSADKRDRVSYYSINYEALNSSSDEQEEKKEAINEPLHEVNLTQSHEVNMTPSHEVNLTPCIYNENQRQRLHTENTTENTEKNNKKRLDLDFSFNLSRRNSYERLSDEYKQQLEAYARAKDDAKNFEAFVSYHGSKGSIFKNWMMAYNTWCLNAERFEKKSNYKSSTAQTVPSLSNLPKAEDYSVSSEW